MLKQLPDHCLINAPIAHYQTFLITPGWVTFQPSVSLNSVTLLSDPDLDHLLHRCNKSLAHIHSTQPDLKHSPLPWVEEDFVYKWKQLHLQGSEEDRSSSNHRNGGNLGSASSLRYFSWKGWIDSTNLQGSLQAEPGEVGERGRKRGKEGGGEVEREGEEQRRGRGTEREREWEVGENPVQQSLLELSRMVSVEVRISTPSQQSVKAETPFNVSIFSL